MTDALRGVTAMIVACTIWGLSALYYKFLDHIPPLEILAHRTLWSLVLFVAILGVQGRVAQLWRVFAQRRAALRIGFAAAIISLNWFLYISAIQIDQALEASLGYYIFPLVAVLLGAIFYRERLPRPQRLAVGLATLAVVLLTVALGVAPWISVALAVTFGIYGLVKKGLEVGPVLSVSAEVLLLLPLAGAILWHAHAGQGGAFGGTLSDSLLLVLSGPLTAVPLVLLSYAARRISMASLGLTQYLNPTLQFLVATLIFQEPFSGWHAVAFAMIWVALAIYSTAVWRQDKAARRALRAAGASGMVS